MIPLTPCLVTQAATVLLKIRDEGPRRGSIIEAMLDSVGLPADANWAAAFVQFVGYWTHFEHEARASSWPFPMAGTFTQLLQLARRRAVVVDTPRVGDVAVICDRRTHSYEQGGFVVEVRDEGRLGGHGPSYFDCITIEGNTDLQGARDGARVSRVPRRIIDAAGDCLIRWADLEARAVNECPLQGLKAA